MMKLEIGKRLQEVRRHFGYSQARMAALMGIKKVTYGKNERGIHIPDTATLIAISKHLNVSVEWLLFNRGSMFWEEKQPEKPQPKDTQNIFSKDVEEMLELMQKVPLLLYSVMMHYQQFKKDNEAFIQETIAKGAST